MFNTYPHLIPMFDCTITIMNYLPAQQYCCCVGGERVLKITDIQIQIIIIFGYKRRKIIFEV